MKKMIFAGLLALWCRRVLRGFRDRLNGMVGCEMTR